MNASGYMPLNANYGFIFVGGDYSTIHDEIYQNTIAHELGHGIFKLYHPYDVYNTPERQTNNLMDYQMGATLWKPQWDWIHDPGIRTYMFQSAEEGASMAFRCMLKSMPAYSGTKEGELGFAKGEMYISTGMYSSNTSSCDIPVYYHIARDGDKFATGWYRDDEYATKVVKNVIVDLCVINEFIGCTFRADVENANKRIDDFFKAKPISFDFLVFAEKYYAEVTSENKDFCNKSGRADPTFELFDVIELAASFGTVTVFKKLATKTGEELLEEVAEVSLRNWSKSALKEGNYIVYTALKDGKLYIGKTVDDMAFRYTQKEIDEIAPSIIINNIPNNGTAKGVEQAIMELNGFIGGKANKAINPLSNIYNSSTKKMYKEAGIEWLTKNHPNWKVEYLFR